MRNIVLMILLINMLASTQTAPTPQLTRLANVASIIGTGFAGASLGLQAGSYSQEQNRGSITLYQHSDHGGERITTKIYPGFCVNIPNFNDRTSSVHTRDECYILWEHKNCQGSYHIVAPGAGCHFNLETCGFNDRTSAVQRCNF